MAVLKLQKLQPATTNVAAPVLSLTSSGSTCCSADKKQK